jgi:RNA polymerase sigma factor (sigma-70 family)
MSHSREVGRGAGSAEVRFERLYELHHRSIRDYCRRRLAAHRVDDAVAETFLTAWRRLDDIPDDEGTLLWLYRVAYRVVGHHWRGLKRWRRLDQRLRSVAGGSPVGPDELTIDREDHRLVLRAVERLGRTDAEVLRLATWEHLSMDDIATMLDIEPNAVKQRLHRARRNLANEFRRLDARTNPTPDPLRGGAR